MSDSSDLHSETSPADTDGLATTADCAAAATKVRDFPQSAGVYLMKDSAGRVIYVGKAKNLRSRAGSYFLKAAEVDRRTADLVREIRDIDYLEADSEVIEISTGLSSWTHFEEFIEAHSKERELLQMLKLAIKAKRNMQMILRIKQRYNKVNRNRTNIEMLDYMADEGWG